MKLIEENIFLKGNSLAQSTPRANYLIVFCHGYGADGGRRWPAAHATQCADSCGWLPAGKQWPGFTDAGFCAAEGTHSR